MTDTSIRDYNYITINRFYVEMQESSYISASFNEFSGLGADLEHEVFYEGGVNNQQRVMLKDVKFSNVTLKRGMSNDLVFLGWASSLFSTFKSAGSDTKNISDYRRNVNILLFNQAGETIQTWTLIGAIPVSWKAPSLQADGTSVAIEELTLAYEGLKIYVNNTLSSSSSSSGATIHSSGRDATGYFASN
ncbi:phage tail protein [Spirulina sp. 06S082]|uniref:phage tail protein n=1 Tax=Spirulina sp. 06S082 TaxID=3110248 RepID=UPI002B215472|nr:phage tail protein [Spirulina sp. 06S082]MEA5471869.1 phage tail protein [Spirulina sp. 06S082]